jgi:hypothetical protein
MTAVIVRTLRLISDRWHLRTRQGLLCPRPGGTWLFQNAAHLRTSSPGRKTMLTSIRVIPVLCPSFRE